MAEIVQQHGMNYIFPKTIPQKRSNRDVRAKQIICCIFLCLGPVFTENHKITFLVHSLSWTFLLFLFIQICVRFCHLCEECFHLSSRYERKVVDLLRNTFSFSNNDNNIFFITVASTAAVGIALLFENPVKSIKENDNVTSWIFILIGMFFSDSFINLGESPLATAKLIDDLKALDYGSGIAFSFFYGYLNLMLPCTGDERKGLKEQIEIYESKHKVKFGSKKLYILIPLSAYCPSSINENSNYMTTSESLDWRRLDRAGVKQRQYHNSVYKLWVNKKQLPVYICAEYATPLLTLHEVMNQNTEESRRYKKYQKEIVTNFYLTLDKILRNNRNCKGLAELIYYRDIDNDGNPLDHNELDIGLLLFERIEQENLIK